MKLFAKYLQKSSAPPSTIIIPWSQKSIGLQLEGKYPSPKSGNLQTVFTFFRGGVRLGWVDCHVRASLVTGDWP